MNWHYLNIWSNISFIISNNVFWQIFLVFANNAFFQIKMDFFSNESGDSGEEDIYGTESPDKHTSVVMKKHTILNSQTQTSKDQDGKWFKFTCSDSAKAKAQRFLSSVHLS